MKMWLTCDGDDDIDLWIKDKPSRDSDFNIWDRHGNYLLGETVVQIEREWLPPELQNISWPDEPIEVKFVSVEVK